MVPVVELAADCVPQPVSTNKDDIKVNETTINFSWNRFNRAPPFFSKKLLTVLILKNETENSLRIYKNFNGGESIFHIRPPGVLPNHKLKLT